MRKILLTLTALVLSLGAMAQVGLRPNAGLLQKFPATSVTEKKAPSQPMRIQLADNQLIMGPYVTDEVASSDAGLGLTSVPGTLRAASLIPVEDVIPFDGGKVVKFRVGLANSAQVSRIFIGTFDAAGNLGPDLFSQDVSFNSTGWNEVTLDAPVTLDFSNVGAILLGFDYEQGSNAQAYESYPLSMVNAGSIAYNVMVYGNLGSGTGWYNLGSDYGNLSVQAVVEGDFAENAATPSSFGNIAIKLGGSTDVSVPVVNFGKADMKSLSYTVAIDGVEGEEQDVTLASPVSFGGKTYFTIPFKAADVEKTETRTVTIKKVNGEPNKAARQSVSGLVGTTTKEIVHRVAVEELTGTGCPWCPRGMVGMENLRNTFGDLFVGIAIHQYNSSDAMYIDTDSYAPIGLSSAPSCTFERSYITDPYYGGGEDVRDDFRTVQAEQALAGVTVKGMWNEDQTEVTATALVETPIDGVNYDVEFVLVADSLSGTGAGWIQGNNYAQYNASQLPEDLAIFGKGGKYGTSRVAGWKFNDVAIASSYSKGVNQVATLEGISAVDGAEASYTLSMPTRTSLKNAINPELVYVIALVIDENGQVVNAHRASIDAYQEEVESIIVEGEKVPVVETLTVNHEEVEKTAYSAKTESFDVNALVEALGISNISEAAQYIVNVTTGEAVANTTDGWRNAQGDAETWGSSAGMVCVKINNPASGVIDYIGCIDDTHVAGETYTAKWGFVANGKAAVVDVVINFVEKQEQEITRSLSENVIKARVEYETTEASYVEKVVELTDEQVSEILGDLQLESLADAQIFGWNPTTETFTDEFGPEGFDGWRDANGDFHKWSGNAEVPACVKATDGKTYLCYNIGGCEPQEIKCYYAIANDTRAVLVEVTFAYVVPADISELNTDDQQEVIYNLNGVRMKNTQQKGVYIINGKKVVR